MTSRLFAVLLLVLAVVPNSARASEAPSIHPSEALRILKEGNGRHVAGSPNPVGDAAALRRSLARDGQRPAAAVIACADSRVPVEAIFDQPAGGLFVIRAAGNTAGVEAVGSVQYGVEHLGIPLVVVLGHTQCGAVGAVLSGETVDGCLAAMLGPIRSAARDASCDVARGGDRTDLTTVANARRAADTLLANVLELRRRVGDGRAQIVCAVYDIENGKVLWLP